MSEGGGVGAEDAMAVHHQAEDGGGGVGGEAGVVAQDPRNNHLSLDTVLDTCLSCSLSSTSCPASASQDFVSTLKYLCYQFIQQFELKIRSPKPEPKNIPWIPGAAADSRAKIKLEPSQRL